MEKKTVKTKQNNRSKGGLRRDYVGGREKGRYRYRGFEERLRGKKQGEDGLRGRKRENGKGYDNPSPKIPSPKHGLGLHNPTSQYLTHGLNDPLVPKFDFGASKYHITIWMLLCCTLSGILSEEGFQN